MGDQAIPGVLSEARVRLVLNAVIDPCSVAAGAPAGLDDMGLVRSVSIRSSSSGAAVRVSLCTTEPGCVMPGPFAQEARERLCALSEVSEVEVELDATVDWSPADMSPDYRSRLEAVRAARREALGLSPDGARLGLTLPVVRVT